MICLGCPACRATSKGGVGSQRGGGGDLLCCFVFCMSTLILLIDFGARVLRETASMMYCNCMAAAEEKEEKKKVKRKVLMEK